MKWTEGAVIAAIASHFEWWRHTMCPNVMSSPCTEMDLAVLTKAGLLWEVEVKVSMADWKNDLKKDRRYGTGWKPARFYFAVPESLLVHLPRPADCRAKWRGWAVPEWVPAHAGVLVLAERDGRIVVRGMARQAKALHRNQAGDAVRLDLLRKIAFRYWKHVSGTEPSKTLEVDGAA